MDFLKDLERQLKEIESQLAEMGIQVEEPDEETIWNDAEHCFNHAQSLYYQSEYSTAEKFYKRSIKLGNINAFREIGQMYSIDHKEPEKALEWFKKGAKAGDFQCYFYMGVIYLSLDMLEIEECAKVWERFTSEVIKLIETNDKEAILDDDCDLPDLYYQMVREVVEMSAYHGDEAIEIISENHNHKLLISLCHKYIFSRILSRYGLSSTDDIVGIMNLDEDRREELLTMLNLCKDCLEYIIDSDDPHFT